eukprot:6143113-Pleurochrysis_carterae.AAC.1
MHGAHRARELEEGTAGVVSERGWYETKQPGARVGVRFALAQSARARSARTIGDRRAGREGT